VTSVASLMPMIAIIARRGLDGFKAATVASAFSLLNRLRRCGHCCRRQRDKPSPAHNHENRSGDQNEPSCNAPIHGRFLVLGSSSPPRLGNTRVMLWLAPERRGERCSTERTVADLGAAVDRVALPPCRNLSAPLARPADRVATSSSDPGNSTLCGLLPTI
jgi:hypothetical protein